MRDKAFSAAGSSEGRAGIRSTFLYEGPDALPLLPLLRNRQAKVAESVAHQRISLRAPMAARELPPLAIAAGRELLMTPGGEAAMMGTAIAPSQTEAWEQALLNLPAGASEVETLRDASLRFLRSPWLGIAMAADWDEIEIWGCFPSSRIEVVRRRGDCLGLVPALTLGLGCSIERIDRHGVTITRKRTGSRLIHRRKLPGRQYAVLWWHAAKVAQETDQ
jgi:hypothetical protein